MSGVAAAGLSNAHADQIMSIVKAGLRVVLTSPVRVEPGQAVTAALVPASPEIDASDLVNGVLNLGWTAKNVLFSDAAPVDVPSQGDLEGDEIAKDPTKVGIAGGQPFPPPAPVLGGGSAANPAGILSQVFGTFASPSLKIRLEVQWVVRDQAGNKLRDDQDFIAQNGLASPDISIVLPPAFREFRPDTILNPGGSVVCLSAEVALSIAGHPLPTFEVGPVPVLVLPLLIPTVVALFSEPNFGITHDSSVLIVVPEHSPFSSAEPLFKTLKRLEAVVSSLRGIASIATWLLGLDELIGSVPEQPRIRFVAANQVSPFSAIKLKKKPWYNFLGSDPNFDDKVFSILVVGLPGTKVGFFDDTRCRTTTSPDPTDQGNFVLHVGSQHFVAVRTLATSSEAKPVAFPASDPLNAAHQVVPFFEPDNHPDNDGRWHTDMSSLCFQDEWLNVVEKEIKKPEGVPPLLCAQGPAKPKRPRPTAVRSTPRSAGTRRPSRER